MVLRFSLRSALGLVAAICTSLAALLTANQWWLAALSLAVLLSLSYGCTSVALRGKERSYWAGFVIFVVVSLSLMLLPTHFRHPFPSISEDAYFAITGRQRDPGPFSRAAAAPPTITPRLEIDRLAFHHCFNALGLLWMGALGGFVGQRMSFARQAISQT